MRSSHRRCSVRRGFLRNFAKFSGKYLRQSLFFSKVAGVRPATLLKKRLWHRRFPMNFAKFLRTPFLWNTTGRKRLLLPFIYLINFFLHGLKLKHWVVFTKYIASGFLYNSNENFDSKENDATSIRFTKYPGASLEIN